MNAEPRTGLLRTPDQIRREALLVGGVTVYCIDQQFHRGCPGLLYRRRSCGNGRIGQSRGILVVISDRKELFSLVEIPCGRLTEQGKCLFIRSCRSSRFAVREPDSRTSLGLLSNVCRREAFCIMSGCAQNRKKRFVPDTGMKG